jgi:hypothetical protein
LREAVNISSIGYVISFNEGGEKDNNVDNENEDFISTNCSDFRRLYS